ncbi:MAG: hydroxyisourate hydrolase [Gemmatimonadota bacterium]
MLSTQVIDVVTGGPAVDVGIELLVWEGDHWVSLNIARTDGSGRVRELMPIRVSDTLPGGAGIAPGRYRIEVELGGQIDQSRSPFFAAAGVTIEIPSTASHCHVPLTVGPYTFSALRTV